MDDSAKGCLMASLCAVKNATIKEKRKARVELPTIAGASFVHDYFKNYPYRIQKECSDTFFIALEGMQDWCAVHCNDPFSISVHQLRYNPIVEGWQFSDDPIVKGWQFSDDPVAVYYIIFAFAAEQDLLFFALNF